MEACFHAERGPWGVGRSRRGARMDKRGRASRLYRVNLLFHAGVPVQHVPFLLVLGQEEVQEEGHDEADGVGRLQEDDRRRPVRVRALVVLGAAPVWKSTGESGGARREILASAQSSTRRCCSCTCAPARPSPSRPGTSCTSCSGAKTQCCAAGSSRRRTPRRRPRRGAVPWRRRCRGPSTA